MGKKPNKQKKYIVLHKFNLSIRHFSIMENSPISGRNLKSENWIGFPFSSPISLLFVHLPKGSDWSDGPPPWGPCWKRRRMWDRRTVRAPPLRPCDSPSNTRKCRRSAGEAKDANWYCWERRSCWCVLCERCEILKNRESEAVDILLIFQWSNYSYSYFQAKIIELLSSFSFLLSIYSLQTSFFRCDKNLFKSIIESENYTLWSHRITHFKFLSIMKISVKSR